MRIQLENKITASKKTETSICLVTTNTEETKFIEDLKNRFNNKSSAVRINALITITNNNLYITIGDKSDYTIANKVTFNFKED